MPSHELRPTHKLVQAYYAARAQFDRHRVTHESAVRQPFLDLLRAAAGPRRSAPFGTTTNRGRETGMMNAD